MEFLTRYRILAFLVVALGLTIPGHRLEGKSEPIDILIQTTTDSNAELAPCG